MKPALLVGFVMLALTGMVMATGLASAHSTDDEAPDTPLGSEESREQALDNFSDALERSEAENSLVRNPTCGAHFGPDGIHPPGNA